MQLRDGGLEFSDALSDAAEFSKVLPFPCFGLLEAAESIARNRFVARGLGTQLAVHHRFALQLIPKGLQLVAQRFRFLSVGDEGARRWAAS